MHHVPDPAAALAEIGRAVKPGGRVLIVEQQAHRCEAFHELMQDRWWGFEPEALARQVEAAGFTGARTRVLRSATSTSAAAPETPELFVMVAEKAGRTHGPC